MSKVKSCFLFFLLCCELQQFQRIDTTFMGSRDGAVVMALAFHSSIGNGGIGTKCAENPTRKKCAKIPRSNISGICGISGMPRSNFPRSNISGMPRSNFPRSNGKIKMTKKKMATTGTYYHVAAHPF